ncbi:S-adenosyl-l-methionine hydroxide adenosyltransferase family protein [Neobacillus sp. OS1-32]|uniref:S-adenosyl-l-methionine hydroxide adenosyltransferase family protein n=1 Tax=Neobacillus paridis TaxID=2803862 RepID=A0ABS1TVN4_9BACI|nr:MULTISPECIES: S-adenosyl-l-methionine hydroxide adenosyltransferase family protein [Neobacillus]MBL4954628.1 S-adenosyl-l-methionine hydroxide adenosyltransferase family protein [Neobacillus paridis]WML29954.1 S-adenosyl-l-methionine hydroxide adenosyltransferase family protein [Neobacillus sp. OS1-32]
MNNNLVLQTDFGLSDGAVSAMYGVAISVNPGIRIFDLTHDIPQYNIWEGSYRLYQTVAYWPEGTVFVSVVDPGVGSERRSIVAKTALGQYIVTPDNGTLTHIKSCIGIEEVRMIDESVNRLPNSGESYTFHGRDVYAYTGARLSSNIITFEQVGPEVPVDSVIELPKDEPKITNQVLTGNIDILDVRFGNLWTNIDRKLLKDLAADYGDSFEVTIENDTRQVYKNIMTYGRTFADIHLGEPLLYVNSLDKIGVAINQGSFAKAYHIETGASWKISIRKIPKIVYN